jgi:hypothetical protein
VVVAETEDVMIVRQEDFNVRGIFALHRYYHFRL